MGGVRAYRAMLALALELLRLAQPKVVAMDMILTDQEDAPEDDRLEHAMQARRIWCWRRIWKNGRWENPLHAVPPCRHRDGTRSRRRTFARRRDAADSAGAENRGRKALGAGAGDFPAGGRRSASWSRRKTYRWERCDSGRAGRRATGPVRVLFTREPIPQISLMDLWRTTRTGRALQRADGVFRRDFDFGHVRPRCHALRPRPHPGRRGACATLRNAGTGQISDRRVQSDGAGLLACWRASWPA